MKTRILVYFENIVLSLTSGQRGGVAA